MILPVTLPAFIPTTHTLSFLLPFPGLYLALYLSGLLPAQIHLWTSLSRLAILPFLSVL